ncbi:hypothetical protein POTOM_026850 [Populus tomentosa]|uniref:Uncharacterized protein n=1 Tax=Populus tomentosa TaxID=118781 RepID=A0A8X7ZKP6_POPTO|nr:hypothetical protein POTOM_026850 [Populus tomentosa]
MLDGTLVLNPANKLSAYHGFDYGKCKLKYCFAHQGGTTTEPGYEFGMTSWNIAASQRFCDDNVLRVSYEKWRTELGSEWSRDSKLSFCIGHEFTDMVFTALLKSTIRASIGIDGEY